MLPWIGWYDTERLHPQGIQGVGVVGVGPDDATGAQVQRDPQPAACPVGTSREIQRELKGGCGSGAE